MSTTWSGMDPAAVHDIGAQLRKAGADLNRLASSIDTKTNRAAAVWTGRDVDRFAQDWRRSMKPGLAELAQAIDGLGQSAQRNAQEQSEVSSTAAASQLDEFVGLAVPRPELIIVAEENLRRFGDLSDLLLNLAQPEWLGEVQAAKLSNLGGFVAGALLGIRMMEDPSFETLAGGVLGIGGGIVGGGAGSVVGPVGTVAGAVAVGFLASKTGEALGRMMDIGLAGMQGKEYQSPGPLWGFINV